MASSSHEMFEAHGNPWCLPEDWVREAKLADNPRGSTAARESARSFVGPARKKDHKRAQAKAPFQQLVQPVPVSERSKLQQIQRENFKALLATMGVQVRTNRPFHDPADPPVRIIKPFNQAELHADRKDTDLGNFPKVTVKPDRMAQSHARQHDIRTMRELRKAYVRAYRKNDDERAARIHARIESIEKRLGVKS